MSYNETKQINAKDFLDDLITRKKDIDGLGVLYLDDNDVMRHRLVKKVIQAYKTIENRNQIFYLNDNCQIQLGDIVLL